MTVVLFLLVIGAAGWWEWREHQKKVAAEEAAATAKMQADLEAERREIQLRPCLDEAESNYWRFVRMNGGVDVKGKPGVVRAPDSTWNAALANKNSDISECQTRYGK